MGRRLPACPPTGQLIPHEPLSTTGNPIPFPSFASFTFPFHRLPLEIRRNIYRLLFRSTIPIYPAVPASTLKAHETIQRTSFPTNFLLVDAQTEREATQALWGENKIVFQFPLDWNEIPRAQRWYSRSKVFIPHTRHLVQIQRLVIEVYLYRHQGSNALANVPVTPATSVRRELKALCEGLGGNHSIRKCEIRFTNVKTRESPSEVLTRWKKLEHFSGRPNQYGGCCINGPRSGFGRRDLQVHELEELCRESVDVDQQVLEPLTALRGIGEVTIVGRVTEDWKNHIRACMTAGTGTEVEKFVHRTTVLWEKRKK